MVRMFIFGLNTSYYGPVLWNKLPADLRCEQCQLSKAKLKDFCSLRLLPDFLYLLCPFVMQVSC